MPDIPTDLSTGLPQLPAEHFWRVRKGRAMGWEDSVQLRKFVLGKISRKIAEQDIQGTSHSLASRQQVYDTAAKMAREFNDPSLGRYALYGDYPPKTIIPKGGYAN